jgi:hypothetical protein
MSEKNNYKGQENPRKEETGFFKPTNRHKKDIVVYFEPVQDKIPSKQHEKGYSAEIKYDKFKDRIYLTIENGVSQAALIVECRTRDNGINLIEELKQDKRVADYVYKEKKGIKNLRLESVYDAINDGYMDIKFKRATQRIKRGESADLEISIEDEALEPVKDITKKLTKEEDCPFGDIE